MSPICAFGLIHGGSPRSETTITLPIRRNDAKRPRADRWLSPLPAVQTVKCGRSQNDERAHLHPYIRSQRYMILDRDASVASFTVSSRYRW